MADKESQLNLFKSIKAPEKVKLATSERKSSAIPSAQGLLKYKKKEIGMKICSIENCNKPHYARSWCQMHYTRWQRHGDPLITLQRPYLTKEEINQICQEYQEGKNSTQLAEKFNVIPVTILYWLIKNNIKRCSVGPGPKYHFNKDYFNQRLDEHRAYHLGFIMADGCIYKDSLQLNLHWKDKSQLEKFRKDIQSDYSIYHIKNVCRLMIYSKKLCNFLAKYNIVPRKSLIAKTPTNIPPELMCHFFRGMFDGDGCLSYRKDRKYWQLQFCGTKDIVENFIKFTGEDLKLGRQRNTFVCSAQSHKALRIANLLYKDATIYLDRKYKLYQQMAKT